MFLLGILEVGSDPRGWKWFPKSQCHLLVEVLQEYEAGGGAYDGGQPPDGCCVGDAQWEAFADHVVMPGLVPVLAAQPEIRGLRGQDQDLSLQGDTFTSKAGDQNSSPAGSNARVIWGPEMQQVCVRETRFFFTGINWDQSRKPVPGPEITWSVTKVSQAVIRLLAKVLGSSRSDWNISGLPKAFEGCRDKGPALSRRNP